MDSFKHRGRRRKLIADLRAKNRFDDRVLDVMANVPRHLFINSAFAEHAYEDKPWPIDRDQTISQPSTVAWQTSVLSLLPRQKILEIGTGSGYQAAILSLLGGRVFTVERHEPLWRKSRLKFRQLKLGNIRCFLRDGHEGLPEFAPFDRILATAAAEKVPENLKQQLSIGGLLIIPVGGSKKNQRLMRIERVDKNQFKQEDLGSCAFVPFLEGVED
ncbi:MAG: protein-L-isoaspartate(D-aspartate) O-methyltransferase [Bacteroidota bacterium]